MKADFWGDYGTNSCLVGCTEYLTSERPAATYGEDHMLYHTWGSNLILVGEVCLAGRSQLGVILPNIGHQVLCQILLLGRNPNIQTWWDFFKVWMFSSYSCMPNNRIWGRTVSATTVKFFFIIFLCLLSAYMPHSPHEVSGSDLYSPGIWSYQ